MVPVKACSNKCYPQGEKAVLPEGLVGPSSVVPVLIEGIYSKALLDSGSQVTLLYRSFYDRHLKHFPLTPIENLQIWGLSADEYPYDGYLRLKLEFTGAVVGVTETIETLVLVCPDPAVKGEYSILVGTNTSIVRRLYHSCKDKGGDNFLHTLTVHPMIREAYERFKVVPNDADDGKRGTVWFSGKEIVTLPPGGVATVTGIPKYPGSIASQAVLIEHPQGSSFPEELVVMPELKKSTAVLCRRIQVTVRNVTAHAVTLKRGMSIAHLYPVDVVSMASGARTNPPKEELTPAVFNFGDSPVPEEWKERLSQKMMERKDVFSCSEFDVGCAKSAEHQIRTTEDKPFRERSRRLAPCEVEDVRRHLNDLKKAGIISESRSPYASPIVVVRKKNGTIRMCVDYRTLNRRTIPDQYTVPRVEDALACLSGSQWFSVLDLRSGYYQIPLSEADKEKTAFICPVGFYQFERMPQGISGAPATFQRVMEKTIGDMNLLEVLVYLDDIIVFGRTLEEHEERLLKVLDRLKDEGLKLSLDKCQFCRTSVTYLGHVISRDGVATDASKKEAVETWPRPDNITKLRSFLGFCGYYRRFVKDYSRICFPLNQLLQGCVTASQPGKKAQIGKGKAQDKEGKEDKDTKMFFHPSEPFGSRWDEQCEKAFESLKKSLTEAPLLAFADPNLPYTLHVDASREGLGGVLYQNQGQGMRPVAFVSRSLSPSEKNYPTHKLEFLALKWVVTEKLRDYLYGAKFEVHTDNNPLTYVLTSAKLDAAGHRWLADLSTFDFSLTYRPGKQNIDADALSRRSHSATEIEIEKADIPVTSVRAMCQLSHADLKHARPHRAIDLIGASRNAIPRAYCNLSTISTQQLPKLSSTEISQSQQEDPVIGEVWKAVNKKNLQCADKSKHADVSLLLKEWGKLKIRDGVLYRVSKPQNKSLSQQLVLPQKYRETVLKSLHDQSGHLGFDKTYGLVRARFYWARMKTNVEKYCKTCARCIKRKTLPQTAAVLSHMTSEGPMDLVCMDFLSVEPDSKNLANVLVITDHYTRYAQAFPTKDQKATTVAKVLWENYFVHYGLPKRIHSDQGRDFESRLIHELLGMLGVKKSRTTPYHPQGDPQPERFNRTLLNMLGTLDADKKIKWSQHISHLVHAYNCTQNESTGYSPYFLMFGREARMPVDLCFGVSSDGSSVRSYLRYVQNLRRDLQVAFQLAESAAGKKNQGNKRRYDQRVRYVPLAAGDKVLIRNLGLQGKHKLADRWSSIPYIVENKMSELPVYRLRPENGDGPVKVLHRNHILPLGEDVRLESEISCETPKCKRTNRRRTGKRRDLEDSSNNVSSEHVETSDSESDSDEMSCYYLPQQQGATERDTDDQVEPFGLDLDVAWPESDTGQYPVSKDLSRISLRSNVDLPIDVNLSVDLSDDVNLPDHVSHENETPEEERQGGIDVQQESRPQRVRKAPDRLTYDVPGKPSLVAS